jgi:hypothetical protein
MRIRAKELRAARKHKEERYKLLGRQAGVVQKKK